MTRTTKHLRIKSMWILIFLLLVLGFQSNVLAQQISKEELIFLTPEWKGERFDDGRPKVPDEILDRMKLVTLEEAWAVLKSANFKHQYADDCISWQGCHRCVYARKARRPARD